jgi:hypothetical protein
MNHRTVSPDFASLTMQEYRIETLLSNSRVRYVTR